MEAGKQSNCVPFCLDDPEINSSECLSILEIQSWATVENKHMRLGNSKLIKETDKKLQNCSREVISTSL